MVRCWVLACVAAAIAWSSAAAGTITPLQDAAGHDPQPVNQADAAQSLDPAVLNGFWLFPPLEPDDPLKLLSDLKLGGEAVLLLPIDIGSDNPLMAGLTPHGASTKFAALEPAGSIDSVSMAAVALVGLGLLGLSLVLWRRAARRSRRRSSRRRNGGLQPA